MVGHRDIRVGSAIRRFMQIQVEVSNFKTLLLFYQEVVICLYLLIVKHETTQHTFAYPLQCRLCSRQYFDLGDLSRHGENDHQITSKEEFEERVLLRVSFKERQAILEDALRQHKCDLCGEGFPSKL